MKITVFDNDHLAKLTEHGQCVGWYLPEDWETFIGTGRVIGHVSAEGEVVSSAYFSNFGNRFGWLGAFIVRPSFQGKGLGTELIKALLNTLPVSPFALGLVSTVEGVRLYRRFGFKEIENTHKFVTGSDFKFPVWPTPEGLRIRSLKEGDEPSVMQLDFQATGLHRANLLAYRFAYSKIRLLVEDENARVAGYALACPGSERLILGPIVAPNTSTALALISELGRRWSGPTRMDVPGCHQDLIGALTKEGLPLERVCPLMTLHGASLGFEWNRYFALVAQGLG